MIKKKQLTSKIKTKYTAMHNCVDIMNLGEPDIKTERLNNYNKATRC